ncbi:hypothetical protein [Haloarchaeobius sp. HRN-SO-5]|uniref:hypothetical protein n=1 Tax=Haloarchaeobius sp. HRN-SO-5 TaxID=3446118 RepID=UPI003EBE29E4
MNRRTLLTTVAGGTLSLAGCTTQIDPGGSDETTRPPENCPTTQGLDVEWPTELDASTVESFVESYEHAYYRDVVVEYEPESRLDSYELSGDATSPTDVRDGWELSYSGSGGVYRPTLSLSARTATLPDGADVVPVSEVDDEVLTEVLDEAAETGTADHHVDQPGETVDRYVDLLASLSDDFEPLSDTGHGDSLYVDVDGTPVELTAEADSFHGDYWWTAWYYVDDQVVRRTTDEATDPQDGTLLECRPSG